MYFLNNDKIIKNQSIEIPVLSPFLQVGGTALNVNLLYKEQKIIFFEKYKDLINKYLQSIGLQFNPDVLNPDNISKLLKKNNLDKKQALIKILCLELLPDCQFFVFTFEFKNQNQTITAAIHSVAHNSPLRQWPLTKFEDFYWLDYYAKKYSSVNQVLFTNYKNQIISAYQANVIAIWNKNLYFVHHKQPYFKHFIQDFIIKNAGQIGIKKTLDKNKGFALKFLQSVDELIIINDLLQINPITGLINHNGTFFPLKTKGWSQKIAQFIEKNIEKL